MYQNLLKNYFIPLNLLIVGAGTFFTAQILTFQIARRIEPPYTIGLSGGIESAVQREAIPFEAYKLILERNIFNSNPIFVPPPAVSLPPVISVVREEKPPVPVKLIGTVAGSETYSYAIIEDPFQRTNKIFRVNDTIAPGIKLLEIMRNRITISRDGRKEDVDTGGPDTTLQAQPRPPFRPSPASPPSPEISQPPPSTFVIDRAVVEEATQDMNKLLSQARLVPNFTGGAADGFRIFSIVPNSLFEKVGIRNGDILHGINGVEMKDPEKAFQVYQMLKDNDRFVIDLMRAGQKMTLNYEVR